MKKLSIEVKGKRHVWTFDIMADSQYMQEWLDDGLNVVEIVNTVPMWVVEYNLTFLWVFMQDLFNFKNPFRGSK